MTTTMIEALVRLNLTAQGLPHCVGLRLDMDGLGKLFLVINGHTRPQAIGAQIANALQGLLQRGIVNLPHAALLLPVFKKGDPGEGPGTSAKVF